MRRLFRPRRPTARRSPHAVVKQLLQPLLRPSTERAKMADRKPLRILCFGDSLTAGYTAMGSRFHPYSRKLQDMVAMAFPDLDVQASSDGKSGDTVCHGFKYRIQDTFYPYRNATESEHYDWTIVLGGTNDLAYATKPEEIFMSLRDVYNVALQCGSKVLALTVPSYGLRNDPMRKRLNDLIKGHKQEGYHVYDLDAAIPYFSMSSSDRNKYWDDEVHFSVQGYDLIGNKVGMNIVKHLVEERAAANGGPVHVRKRRLFRGDETMFTEEDGDPSSLDQGYVVVRRKDLD